MDDSMAFLFLVFAAVCAAYATYKACMTRFGFRTPQRQDPSPVRQSVDRERLAGALKVVAGKIDRILPIAKSDSDEYRLQLSRAGIRMDPATYHGITLMVLSASVLVGVTFSFADESLIAKILFVGTGAVLGLAIPRLALVQASKQRREAIQAELPNGLEMLAAVVATGQPIESGFRIVSAATQGPLSEEFRQVDAEINLTGKTRSEAMGSLAERCQLPSVSIFCSAIVQATEQGAPIARTLKGQASIARKEARAKLEEKANKIPVKQKIPLVMFFVTAMMVLILAPKVAEVFDALSAMLS